MTANATNQPDFTNSLGYIHCGKNAGPYCKSEFNVTTSSQSLHSHRKGNVEFPTIQQSQVINAPSPSYFGGKTLVLETPQPLQSFPGSVQSLSTLDRSWLVDPASPKSIDSKTLAGNDVLEIKNSSCKTEHNEV